MLKIRLALASLLGVSLMAPAVALAASLDPMGYGDGGMIQTPYRAKGRYVFIERVSRRTLVQMVKDEQHKEDDLGQREIL